MLDLSATGNELTEYHIGAAIAFFTVSRDARDDTDWAQTVSLYDKLMMTRPSPLGTLNRTIAVTQLEGPGRGLEELHAVSDASHTERDASVDCCTPSELRVDRKAALHEFQSLLHTVEAKPSPRFCSFEIKARAAITDGELDFTRRSP